MTESRHPAALRASIKHRFGMIARAPEQERKFPVGAESARRLNYDRAEINSLPASVTESFCGVGNPFLLGDCEPGQTVLDLGCGAGLDTLLAARMVGVSGKVIGVDVTPLMIAKARKNVTNLGLANVEVILGNLEALAFPDSSVDLVITNGVFNLCANKPRVLAEVFRVLKHAGTLQMADILLEPHVTPDEVATKGSWSD